jgi:hypothetical protein|tara:strand:+ start:792 stop:935 length:144 start_codon:yes stop_codon:yes gene_type:complete
MVYTKYAERSLDDILLERKSGFFRGAKTGTTAIEGALSPKAAMASRD